LTVQTLRGPFDLRGGARALPEDDRRVGRLALVLKRRHPRTGTKHTQGQTGGNIPRQVIYEGATAGWPEGRNCKKDLALQASRGQGSAADGPAHSRAVSVRRRSVTLQLSRGQHTRQWSGAEAAQAADATGRCRNRSSFPMATQL
jgi:hypothetical protein